ncbi:MAG TPA: hypothetical protein VGJ84_18620 [Polyangiaceae bacterium]
MTPIATRVIIEAHHMLDLYDEFAALIGALEGKRVPYAVCGGLAMAIHGMPRATIDVDLLVPPEVAARILELAGGLGYTIPAHPMSFAEGAVEIRRVTKIDPASDDLLSLDLLLVTPAMTDVWSTRIQVAWEGGTVHVVSKAGLIKLKKLRSSGQDLDDIKKLEEAEP